jgi:hypothetical protein
MGNGRKSELKVELLNFHNAEYNGSPNYQNFNVRIFTVVLAVAN